MGGKNVTDRSALANHIQLTRVMNNGFIAESANIEQLDPAFADVPIARARKDAVLNCVLSNSFGFGGTNATLVFRRDG